MESYKVPNTTVFREVDGKAIALNLETEQYYTMNEMATVMWKLLFEKESLEEIVQAIKSEYDVIELELRTDLHTFLDDLKECGLIVTF